MSKFKYCPRCGKVGKSTKDYFKCPSCKYIFYFHSAATASVYIIKNGQVLLARRKEEPKKGKLDSVGGFLKYGEHPREAAHRETLEETGLRIKIDAELPVNINKYEYQNEIISTLNFSFAAKITGGKMEVMDDVEELLWVPIENIQFDELGFITIKKNLEYLQGWYKEKRK